MNIESYTIVFTGIGGQGLISLLKIIGKALVNEGFKIITSETHGLSQRGGKVTCFLRFGNKVNAPVPMIGSADIIIATEKSCVLDVLKYAKPNKSTKIIISKYEERIFNIEYPSETYVLNSLNEISDNIYFIPTLETVEKSRRINMVILGYILRFLPLNKDKVKINIENQFSSKNIEMNLLAFENGFRLK
ncbi:MAG: 2-oxoacid:acceptor oxidoreductase family protein [Candidatus Hodarchaeota archaeon]